MRKKLNLNQTKGNDTSYLEKQRLTISALIDRLGRLDADISNNHNKTLGVIGVWFVLVGLSSEKIASFPYAITDRRILLLLIMAALGLLVSIALMVQSCLMAGNFVDAPGDNTTDTRILKKFSEKEYYDLLINDYREACINNNSKLTESSGVFNKTVSLGSICVLIILILTIGA